MNLESLKVEYSDIMTKATAMITEQAAFKWIAYFQVTNLKSQEDNPTSTPTTSPTATWMNSQPTVIPMSTDVPFISASA